jgi:hypothetical protein
MLTSKFHIWPRRKAAYIHFLSSPPFSAVAGRFPSHFSRHLGCLGIGIGLVGGAPVEIIVGRRL